jgi:DNA polymerase elongation subunit (family B)
MNEVTPNGMIFVKENVRKSLLAKMLSEFLDTRVMVKSAMKTMKDDIVSSSVFASNSILSLIPTNRHFRK